MIKFAQYLSGGNFKIYLDEIFFKFKFNLGLDVSITANVSK